MPVAQYWDGSYPPSPPAQPSALYGAALPGGGRSTASDVPPSDADSEPEPEPIGDYCFELRANILVVDINENQPEESWVALAVFLEMLLGVRQNVSPDFARSPDWHKATIAANSPNFYYSNPLVAGCHATALDTSSRAAVGGACLARNLTVTIRTLWQSELVGSQAQPTTPSALAAAATGMISDFANTGEAMLGVMLSSAVTLAGTIADNPGSMAAWWLGPFVFEVPSVASTQITSRSVVVVPRPPPPAPPPGSVTTGSSGLNGWQIGVIVAGVVVPLLVLAYGLYKWRKKEPDDKVAARTRPHGGAPPSGASFSFSYGAWGGLFAPNLYYRGGGGDHRLRDAETTPLRFDLGSVLTR